MRFIFWHPEVKKTDEHILSVGSDPRRDYETLVKSQRTFKVKILTRLNIKKFEHFENIEIIKGSFHNKVISNFELKHLYNSATVIVVPIKNVLQPSGYSVTMQALACGKPVIIPKFRGLWDKDSFIHLENCIFYIPEDSEDLGKKINMIMNDKKLQKSIGKNARKLAINVFNLERTNKDLLNLINLHIRESNLIKN